MVYIMFVLHEFTTVYSVQCPGPGKDMEEVDFYEQTIGAVALGHLHELFIYARDNKVKDQLLKIW